MKYTYLIIVFMSFNAGFAQLKPVYGIKGGVNLSGFHTGKGTNSDLVGFNLGGVAKLELGKLFDLQAELNLNSKGGVYRAAPPSPFHQDIKLTYINIPVLGQLNITQEFNFEFGPELGFLISQKGDIANDDIPVFDLNVNTGLSYTFTNGLFFQGRYGYGLTDVIKEKGYKNSCISLSLGYFLK